MATAKLNGTITDDGGLACESRFVYGYVPAFGLATPWSNNLRTGDTFRVHVLNLLGGVTVYFQAQARNALGVTVGTTLTFITVPRAPLVVTTAATEISTGGATLNGRITDNRGAMCQTWFEYGGTTKYGSETPRRGGFGIGAFSEDMVGLSPGSGVHFRAVAVNLYGVGYGQDMSFNGLSDRGGMSGFPLEYLLLREDR